MGDPKKPKKKMEKPSHPWQGERILAENDLKRKYSLKNKKELWIAETELRRIRRRARYLFPKVGGGDSQVEKEKEELLGSLVRRGILSEGVDLAGVLSLEIEALLGRRLQTIVYLKGLASTQKQARQFITHGHVAINGRKVKIPGYIVKREEESHIAYYPNSVVASDMHPLRKGEEELTEEDLAKRQKVLEEKPEPVDPRQARGRRRRGGGSAGRRAAPRGPAGRGGPRRT